jgi:hypothetical protein
VGSGWRRAMSTTICPPGECGINLVVRSAPMRVSRTIETALTRLLGMRPERDTGAGESPLPPPHFLRQFDNEAQLGPLFFLGEDVAFFRGGESALRRQGELV